MRVVVTGAAGFIGSHLCDALLAEEHTVVGVDAFTPFYDRVAKDDNVAAACGHRGFRLVEADLRHDDLRLVLAGADAVVHAAAMAGLPSSWTDIETYTSCNLWATHRLLEAARAAGVGRFLHVSTSSVYGVHAVGDESLPTRPVSPYGVTKLAAEHLVLAYVELFGFPASILRYFSVYGPRQRPDMAYHRFVEALLDGRPVQVFGDGLQSRSNTYVGDCVAGTLRALHGAEAGEVYNIGGGEEIALGDAVTVIADVLGVEPVLERLPERVGDQRRTAADVSKARRTFGYEPHVSPADGLRAQVAWHLARRAHRRGA